MSDPEIFILAPSTDDYSIEEDHLDDDQYESKVAERHSEDLPALPQMPPAKDVLKCAQKLFASTESYNLLVSMLGQSAASDDLKAKAERALHTNLAMTSLLAGFRSKVARLHRRTWDFVRDAAAKVDSQWYRNVMDLTDWEPDTLNAILLGDMPESYGWGHNYESSPEIRDLFDFARYLQEALPKAARRDAARINGADYADNVRLLMRAIDVDDPPGLHAEHLRLELVYKTHVCRWDSPRVAGMTSGYVKRLHGQANHNIRSLLNLSEVMADEVSYWNFVKGFHILYDVWYDPMLDTLDDIDWTQDFRRQSFEVLGRMHRKASDEIRASVALVANGVQAEIPTELELMIYEATMEAERVPLVLPPDARTMEDVDN